MKQVHIGIGNYGASGTFWLDDVQLELGAPASPFTPDVRKTSPAAQ